MNIDRNPNTLEQFAQQITTLENELSTAAPEKKQEILLKLDQTISRLSNIKINDLTNTHPAGESKIQARLLEHSATPANIKEVAFKIDYLIEKALLLKSSLTDSTPETQAALGLSSVLGQKRYNELNDTALMTSLKSQMNVLKDCQQILEKAGISPENFPREFADLMQVTPKHLLQKAVLEGNLSEFINSQMKVLKEFKQLAKNDKMSVTDFKKNLKLLKEDICKASREGNLASFIDKRYEVFKDNDALFNKYVISDGSKMEAKNHLPIPISLKEVAHVLRVAKKTDDAVLKAGLLIPLKGHSYVLKQGEDGKLHVFINQNSIGKGGLAVVYKTLNITEPQVVASKIADQTNKIATRDLINEKVILEFVGKNRGIQDAPHLVYNTKGNHDPGNDPEASVGLIVSFYNNGGLTNDKFNMLSKEKQLDGVHQLLSGLAHFQKLGVLHGDLKPENFLCREQSDGSIDVHIGDWGGARRFSELTSQKRKSEPLSYTPGYYQAEDHAVLSNNTLSQSEWAEKSKKRDVCAMGISLYYLMSDPSKRGVYDRFAPFSINEEAMKANGWSPAIVKLLRAMTTEKLKDRISSEECIAKFNKLVIKENPELAQKLGIAKLKK